MLTRDVLKSYLAEMPLGHIFDLTYGQFGDMFPPGEGDAVAEAALRQFAESCGCEVTHNAANGRYELTRR